MTRRNDEQKMFDSAGEAVRALRVGQSAQSPEPATGEKLSLADMERIAEEELAADSPARDRETPDPLT